MKKINFIIIFSCIVFLLGFGCSTSKSISTESKKKTYYPSGILMEEVDYRAGNKIGVGKTYYESGELKARLNYYEGKLEGRVIEKDMSRMTMTLFIFCT